MQLSKVQQEAVNFYTGCCNVIASAGSGKSACIVNRIQKLIKDYRIDPENILAITFSKKAKENMLNRLTKMIPSYAKFINIETFHSFGYRIVRKFSNEKFEILDADWKIVKIFEEIFQKVLGIKEPDGQDIADAISKVSVLKNRMRKPGIGTPLARVYKAYENYKQEHCYLDFDDMLTKCYELLSTNERVLSFCQNRYRFILADEMQDTNAIQYEILRLIGDKNQNVFFVGDPLQAIYGFRGSDNTYIMDFDKAWNNAKIIHLNKNYRSSEDIVQAANHFAECIPESQHRHYVKSVANQDEFEKPHYSVYYDEHEEAEEIAEEIMMYVEAGYHYKDIAILTRTNAQLQNFETALHQNEIPYSIVGGMSFADRREIKILLCYLRLINDTSDDEAFEYVYNRPNRYLGKVFLQEVKREARKEGKSFYQAMLSVAKSNWRYRNGADELRAVIENVNGGKVSDIIKTLRNKLDLDSYVAKGIVDNDDNRIENLNSLQYMASKFDSIKKFVSLIEKISSEKTDASDSVQLMTIHKSKGLEFPIVFVAGVNEGLLPHKRCESVNEEKRLMYVAMTRAERILHISSTNYYNGSESEKSRFIKFIF